MAGARFGEEFGGVDKNELMPRPAKLVPRGCAFAVGGSFHSDMML